MSNVADELQILLDKNRISELLTRYLRAIDRGDIDTLRSCYARDATEEHGGLYAGTAQGYIDSIQDSLRNPRLVGTHTLTNVIADVDGDTAVSEHYVLALTRVRVEAVVTDYLVSSRIIDDLTRVDGSWLIARRRLRFDWSQELGPRPALWLGGRLDPAKLLHGSKFPDDPIYDHQRPVTGESAGRSGAESGAVAIGVNA